MSVAAGRRGGSRRRRSILRGRWRVLRLRLLRLEVRDLLVLRLLGGLFCAPLLPAWYGDTADDGCARERPSSHHVGCSSRVQRAAAAPRLARQPIRSGDPQTRSHVVQL